MQAVSRRLTQQPSLSSLKSLYPLTDLYYGADRPRYGSSLAQRGVGHLIRKGTGGRSSVSGIVATVFGATGFLGRYLVQQLAKMGSQVLVPFRGSEDSHRHLKLMGDLGQIVPMKYNPRDENSIKAVMAKANVVINLIGREHETRNYSFEEVNHYMAEQLATIAKEHGGIMRFIQVSCLGASPSSPSRMLRAKAAAEEAIMRELPEATIMKSAAMIGTEDRIMNRWAQFAKKYGFLPLIGGGTTKVQPVYVVDVAAAIVAAMKDDGASMGKVYELGGPDIFTINELAELMFETIREWPHYVKVPFPIAKAIATPREILLNKVPFPLPNPDMFNLDQINALTTDTVVSENALTFNELGIVPHKLKGYPVEFLIQYRKGGPEFGSTISEKKSGFVEVPFDLSYCSLKVETAQVHVGEEECSQSDSYGYGTSPFLVAQARKLGLYYYAPSVEGQRRDDQLEHVMAPETENSWGGSFQRVELKGRNVGATMSGRGDGGESHCCINIHINNNIQGANSCVLVGSQIQMRNPGVHLHLEGISLGKGRRKTREEKEDDGIKSGLFGLFVFAFIMLLLFLSLV